MKNNKKGFTLAELLIVVAIIAVLVAISIPIFSAQLEKSREATDLANLRAKYAEMAVSILDTGNTTGLSSTVTLKQQASGWDIASHNVAGVTVPNSVATKNGTVKIAVDKDGKVTFSK